MNYEETHVQLQQLEKELKEKLAQVQKLHKSVGKETDTGDIRNIRKDIQSIGEAIEALSGIQARMAAVANEFDERHYFESGEFATQMLEYCQENGIDVKGEFPVYEVFPYRVKLDTDSQDVYLDRKKVQTMRPRYFVETIRDGKEKLEKASFNEETFAAELGEAYDVALLKTGKRMGTDIYLQDLYKLLAPMGRFRKDYNQQNYAYDLARLYLSHLYETKNGRRFQFGPSRDGKKLIRILDLQGKECFLSTICFYEAE